MFKNLCKVAFDAYFSIAGVGTCTVQNELKKNQNEIYQNKTYFVSNFTSTFAGVYQ